MARRSGQAGGSGGSRPVRRLSRQPGRTARHPAHPQRAARRDPDRQPALHRQGRHRRRGRRGSRGGHHHHRRSGGLDCRRRPRRQGGRLSQLARADAGHAQRQLREGRQAHDAPSQPGPRLHHPGRRRRADLARPQPAAGAQRRPPDDGHLHPRQERSACARRHPRLRGDLAHRHARPQGQHGLQEQPRRLGLYRQTEDARARGGRLRQRAVRPRRGRAGPCPPHAQDGHHGRGAAHHRQPQGVHPRRPPPRMLHQYGLPRPHGRRDPHVHGSRAHDPQGRHARHALDQGLRGLERRHRPRLRAAGPGADRQGHVGDARPHGRHDGAEDRPRAGRRQHRLGAFAHGRHAARAALSQGRCLQAPGRVALTPACLAR